MKKILVVVDMQNDFIDGALGTSEAQAIVSKVEKKIRDFDGEIYYTRDTHKENYLETMEGKNLPVKHCIEYTDGWRIKTEIMAASEGKKVIVIDKPTFGSMELIQIIGEEQKDSIESITLIGLCTDICVISNAMNLKTRFWETPIIVDSACCAGVTPQSHNNAIEAMKMCQITII
ncbi:cysteine hydrolase family protein [Aminipila sp.]|uniref:cysteine hydrolase family protein n=1 Tax=Aminipila sp. TaxID=2060095 RepID=UPI00289E452C|nr:isochorismatase family cysteine hydrolase [Aminipila sp.]